MSKSMCTPKIRIAALNAFHRLELSVWRWMVMSSQRVVRTYFSLRRVSDHDTISLRRLWNGSCWPLVTRRVSVHIKARLCEYSLSGIFIFWPVDPRYYNVHVKGKDIKDAIWWYKYPLIESSAIAGLLCFYNEKVDIFIDGVKEE